MMEALQRMRLAERARAWFRPVDIVSLVAFRVAFGLLMASAVVVETVFAIKGPGRILIEGILNRDYPVVQGAILVVSFIFVFVNLAVDVLYVAIDPRIRVD